MRILTSLIAYFKYKYNYSMLDVTDTKIIELLKVNARISYADIGRQINLTASSVRERILRLEDEGVISKYTVELNHSKLGYNLEAFILINLYSGNLKPFLKIVKSIEEVQHCYRITGAHNLQLKVLLRDQAHLQELLDKLMDYGDTTTHLIFSEVIGQK